MVQRNYTIDAGQAGLGAETVPPAIIAAILSDPYSHFNFGSNTSTNQFPNCGSASGSSSVASLVTSVVEQPSDACQ